MEDRRPIATRSAGWPKRIALGLVAWGVTPNTVSVLSVAFAAVGALVMSWDSPVGWLLAAGCIQLRLVCNLLDGLMAVEGGQGSAVGALYNDVPDRLADGLFLVGAGVAVGASSLGWAAAWVAVLVAYQRYVGASLLGSHDFAGPMAKQHRMFVLTVACVAGSVPLLTPWAVPAALWVIVVGGTLTFLRRLRAVALALEAQ